MKVNRIIIKNFKCYYKESIFDIGDRLTLIIGDNGDGKTKFFDAIDWLFDTSTRNQEQANYISQKRFSELMPDQSDHVMVSMEFEHNGVHTLEKTFTFSFGEKNPIISNYSYTLYSQIGAERIVEDGKNFDKYFDSSIRDYCLFKGESGLDIFTRSKAISNMVETFSELKNFDPYVEFSAYAMEESKKARDKALNSDRKASQAASVLNAEILKESKIISEIKSELARNRKEATEFSALLEDVEKNKETSSQLKAINDRLESLEQKRCIAKSRINEDYTTRLLDDMWILCGFAPIAKDYAQITHDMSKQKTALEARYNRELGAKNAISKIKETLELPNGVTPLELYIPNEQTMRDMLNDHVCKVCGTSAPEGSPAYKYMKSRLDAYLETLNLSLEKEDGTEDKLFIYKYIQELNKKSILIQNEMDFLTSLPKNIENDIDFNEARKKEIGLLDININREEENKKKILAHADGLTEEQLVNAYTNISNWWNFKNEAEKKSVILERDLEEHEATLLSAEDKLGKIVLDSSASTIGYVALILKRINESFEIAKNKNKHDFLISLENASNKYLKKLNERDFTGIIRVIELPDGSASIGLYDSNGYKNQDPNTALQTTMFMSILFAVAELTTIKKEQNYPLIFDAPTSSFSSAKEWDFYKILSTVNKQVIVVTKSFLKEENGRNVLDLDHLNQINGVVYRIEKKKPFDDEDLSTIETTLLKIKEV